MVGFTQLAPQQFCPHDPGALDHRSELPNGDLREKFHAAIGRDHNSFWRVTTSSAALIRPATIAGVSVVSSARFSMPSSTSWKAGLSGSRKRGLDRNLSGVAIIDFAQERVRRGHFLQESDRSQGRYARCRTADSFQRTIDQSNADCRLAKRCAHRDSPKPSAGKNTDLCWPFGPIGIEHIHQLTGRI